MFGKNRRYKKAANALGPNIHKQIMEALAVRENVFTKPEELAFVCAYLEGLMWQTMDIRGCKDRNFHIKMLKMVCDGVIPGRLWDYVERGEALGGSNEFGHSNSRAEYASAREAYDIGSGCGIHDAAELDDNSVVPDNLRRYLVGEELIEY